ncbi:hypothetical protein GOV08_05235 [Candidatus Woesearchaeota archaeon]|nr:hypothetical protein [Candidatus Woesearchaeota archaeon]
MTRLTYIDGGKKVQHIEESKLIVSTLQSEESAEESGLAFIVGLPEDKTNRAMSMLNGLLFSGRDFSEYNIKTNPDRIFLFLRKQLSEYSIVLSKNDDGIMMAGIYFLNLEITDPDKLRRRIREIITVSRETSEEGYTMRTGALYEAITHCINLLKETVEH